ncbi:MAG: hypothetical protein K2L39_05285 [Muribaculaceae bacterium]|nr:hypothetical protein [Muribaculaceae bacterium]
MTRLLKKTISPLFLACILLTLLSCTKETPANPVEAVPPGATQVSVIDLKGLASANGATPIAADGKLTPAAEEAFGMLLPSDLLRPLAAVLSIGDKGVDPSQAVLFTTPKGYDGIILKTTSRELLAESLLPYRDESADFGEYDAYTTGKRLIALSDNLCVIAPDAATVKTVGQRKGGHLISEMVGVKEFLSSPDQTIRSARRASDLFGSKMEGLWLCLGVKINESTISARLSAMQPDGVQDSIGTRIAGKIDPDILSFIPEGTSLVIASGLQEDATKLFGIEDLVKNYFPGEIVMSKTGTTLWYARPAGTITEDNLLSPQVWNFAGALQMPQEEGDMAVRNLQTRNKGLGRFDPSTGCYTLTEGEASVSYGYVDGYFLQSANGPVTFGNSNPFTQDFRGARLAAIIDIPSGSSLRTATGLPCGASLTLKVTDTNIHAKLSLYGNSRPALSTVDAIPLLHNLLPYLTGTR